jgi:hypothetical protein
MVLTRAQDPRTLVGVLGVVLALGGSRWYRLAVVAPGFAVGVLSGVELVPAGASALVRFGLPVGLGLLGAALCHLVERLAMALAGAAFSAGLAWAALPVFWPAAPLWATGVAFVAGLFLFPWVYTRLLPLTTSVLGGVAVAWALHTPRDLRVILGVAFIGLVVQLVRGGGGGAAAAPAKGKKPRKT